VNPRGTGPGERALQALETLLDAQRRAMTTGDVSAMEQAHAQIHALLSDAGWRRDAARGRSQPRLRAALKAAALNAGLAARGEAQAARALAALGVTPGLYTATGGYAGGANPARGVSA
jgi:hypothetical protein